jgi:hypothetical protein
MPTWILTSPNIRAVRTLSDFTQSREVAKIGLQNFASSRLCVILSLVAALSRLEVQFSLFVIGTALDVLLKQYTLNPSVLFQQ